MQLSLTVSKVIFSFLPVLATHTFLPMSTAEFPLVSSNVLALKLQV